MAAGQLSNALRHIRLLLGGPSGSDLNDRELLARFADCRDQDAFATLVRRHGPIVLGVCRRVLDNDHDADDAFQATFLVLARKANSVHWRESVANWLYEVAYRTAKQARSRSTLRQKHERQAGTMHAIHSANGAGWHDLRQVLDDELMHLPEKYRMPLLLCYLHGKTRDEAAEELGCSLQQLKGSLERGKEFLRSRLARRGLSLSAELLATELSSKALLAVPASLMTSTIHGAVAGGVSPSVAALTQGVMQMMFWKKFCFGMLLALAVGVIGSGAGLAVYGIGGQSKQRSTNYADVVALAPLPDEGKTLVEPGPFVVTDKSNGKTVSVPVGRAIEVRLAGTQAATGWETGQVKGDVLLYVNSGAAPDRRPTRPGLEPLPFGGEFQPHAEALDKAVGTYVFCYQAVKEGRAELHMDYITPGGPGVKQRRRSARIAEFKVTIDVTASAAKPSKPAVKDGLSLTVMPAKAVFTDGGPLEFKVALSNVSPDEFFLPGIDARRLAPHYRIEIKQAGREGSWAPRFDKKFEENIASVRLAAGQTHDQLLSFAGEHKYQWTGTDKEPHAFPAPGQYQLFLTVSVTDAGNSKVRWWQGSLVSNPVEFTIADKLMGDAKMSEPVVKDGLAIALKLNKPVFAKGERPAFDVILENRSTKAFQLWINFDVLDYPYSFVNLEDKRSWQVQKRKLKDGNGSRSVTLEPGKSQVLNVVFMYGAYVDAAGQGLRADLPVGKYRLSGTLTFKEGTQNNLVPYWTGEVTTNPVEMEITDKPAGDAKASEPPEKMSIEQLVADLDSVDGAKRVAATKEIFRRGKGIVKDLEKAGAKPAKTIQPPRVDMVYSLLEGSFPGRYTTGHFGIHLNPGVTRKDVNEISKKYGFSLADEGLFHENGHPNCYVALAAGKSLTDVLRQVLSEEPRVVTVNLNYVER
jgi:RNA polymerase sigma-70 factor (ECF subfamily)